MHYAQRLITFTIVWLCCVCVWHNMMAWRAGKKAPKANTKVIPDPPTVRYALILHSTGDPARLKAVSSTWFRAGVGDVGLLVMAPGENAFETTRAAFKLAVESFPRALYFAKFDDDCYVYTRELWRQVEAGGFNYSGYPIRYNGALTFGSGGAGYVLSRGAAAGLHLCKPSQTEYEDAAVGDCMAQRGIRLHDLIGLHPHHPYQMLRWDKNGHPSDRVHSPREPLEGYMNPLSYHYLPPEDILRMHDDIYSYGMPYNRSRGVPRVIHQFWEGAHGRPELLLQKCKENHPDWEHRIWDNAQIAKHFPSAENTAGMLPRDGVNGQLLNHDFYARSGGSLNLLSDIMRYEALMWYGGVYLDADTDCFRPMDHLLTDPVAQGIGFLEKDLAYLDGLVASGVIATHAFSPLSIVLVAELQRTDWNLAPWQSAGPLHFTKILKTFQGREPRYLDVTVMDSYHVYPYHFSDAKPDDLHPHLVRKGAVMDQQWGSTHGSYRKSSWETLPQAVHGGNTSWDRVLRAYAHSHHVGLSTLAKERPRWVVAMLDPQAGLCNRISHVVSTLAFALATDRVLLFDWRASAPRRHENGRETVGHSDYADLFRAPPIHHSYSHALRRFGWSEERAHAESATILQDNMEFLNALRFEDVDVRYHQPVVFVTRYDSWSAPLVKNPLYDAVFLGAGSAEVFATLFRFLFSPLSPAPPTECEWVVQHRSVWERPTAPLSAFVTCGWKHGMLGRPSVLLSDADHSNESHFIQHTEPVGCRTGLQCDRDAVRQLHTYAQCRHAVLTARSTYGGCLTGLGQIPNAFVVDPDGACRRKPTVDPIDDGVLDGEPRQISDVLARIEAPQEHQALLATMVAPSDHTVREMMRALQADPTHRPLVLVTDRPLQWRYLQFVTPGRRVHVVSSAAGKRYTLVPLIK